jgi:hypothetical protein
VTEASQKQPKKRMGIVYLEASLRYPPQSKLLALGSMPKRGRAKGFHMVLLVFEAAAATGACVVEITQVHART